MALPRQTSPATGISDRLAGGMGDAGVAGATDPREAAFQSLFDESRLRVLIALGPQNFDTLYKAAGNISSSPDDSGEPTDNMAKDYTSALNTTSPANTYERFSPGEYMITYSPLNSPEAEALYAVYNKEAIVFSNDVSINDYITEKLQDMVKAFNPHDPDAGLSKEEKAEKELAEEFLQAMQNAHEERMEEQQKQYEKWLDDTHQMGNMSISGHDLQKLIDFMKDPENRKKAEQQMKDDGVDDDTIKKGAAEWDEYVRLQMLAQQGKLTEEQQRRLDEINKSDTFRVYSQNMAEYAQKYGLDLPSMKTEADIKTLGTSATNTIHNGYQAAHEKAASFSDNCTSLMADFQSTQPAGTVNNQDTSSTPAANQETTPQEISLNMEDFQANKSEILNQTNNQVTAAQPTYRTPTYTDSTALGLG